MKIAEVKPNMLCLEYRQEKNDKDYGSCLWARFVFNLDRYELSITSDCGNYGYKWCETPKTESFLQLMARTDKGYMLNKLYGKANIFDYDDTKAKVYKWFGEEEEDKEKLDEIFEEIELYGEPDSASEFIRSFEDNNDGDFCDVWEMVECKYPSNALKIVEVFKNCIQPYIKNLLNEVENNAIKET